MIYTDSSNFKVKTYMASGALPVADVLVKVYGTDDFNNHVKYSLITDNDGLTPEIPLPAPPADLSRSPGSGEAPYAVYNAELAKDGFYPKKIDNIPVFGKSDAILSIEMIPLAYGNDGDVIEQKNLNSTVYENENLQ